MKLVLYSNKISPHQMPVFSRLVDHYGEDNCRYVYFQRMSEERLKLGWGEIKKDWIVFGKYGEKVIDETLETCDVLITGYREVELFQKRHSKGLKTIYTGERWYKPPIGWRRLLSPWYFRMAFLMANMIKRGEISYLPKGVWAARDVLFTQDILSGKIWRFWRKLDLDFERCPGGEIRCSGIVVPNMKMWGYFVESSRMGNDETASSTDQCRFLWVGRMLDWKRVDTIIRASAYVAENQRSFTVDLYGCGEYEPQLRKLARKLDVEDTVHFCPPVSIQDVRNVMRAHDVFILSSDQFEGWGATVSEALSEGMTVLGTYDAGSSSTILDPEHLFEAGDWRGLADLMMKCIALQHDHLLIGQGIGKWSADCAASKLMEFIG